MENEPSVTRAPFQVLVFPYLRTRGAEYQYCLFLRRDAAYWQGIAGGGELGETPIQAARREAREEAGIAADGCFIRLDSRSTIPVPHVRGFLWGETTLVIPEYCFGVEVPTKRMSLSEEHIESRWTTYEEALSLLKWDSNRNGLWELNHRVNRARETV